MSYKESFDSVKRITEMIKKGIIKKEDIENYNSWSELYEVVKGIYAIKDIVEGKKAPGNDFDVKAKKGYQPWYQKNSNVGNAKKSRSNYTR